MSRLARSVQFPVACPECNANTAYSLEKLNHLKQVSCRHCQHEFPLTEQFKRQTGKILRDLEGYVEMPDEAETEEEREPG
ncbi:hypothetical protein [Oceanobacter mangrovi]|uniref:hypothetical protein n=1 Tax=Oceanobacter mangrovi TaxID=2862510 RepID=UPI001C8DD357|nr:hypothetical protein [Oceanobacter mangrovi]